MNFECYWDNAWCERIKGEENRASTRYRLHEKNIPAIKYISYNYVLVESVFARISYIPRTFSARTHVEQVSYTRREPCNRIVVYKLNFFSEFNWRDKIYRR